MKVFRVTAYGDQPAFAEVPAPAPGAGEIGVEIAACALNFADTLMIQGRYQERPDPPVTLGMELAGIVRACGPDVTDYRPGMRVAVYSGKGGLAEYGVFPANRAVQIPDAMPFEVAASILIAHGTSHLALDRRANLRPGETLLVLGAAGGVGLTAVEIGKLMGARVIACARGADRLAIAEDAGADHLIDSESHDLVQAMRDLGRADVVYDPVGGDQFRDALRAVNPEARILAIGFASGDVPQIPANHLLVKNVDVLGLNLGAYLRFAPQAMTHTFSALFDWHSQGKLRPRIGHRLPFDRVNDGLDLLRQRQATGKIVININPADR